MAVTKTKTKAEPVAQPVAKSASSKSASGKSASGKSATRKSATGKSVVAKSVMAKSVISKSVAAESVATKSAKTKPAGAKSAGAKSSTTSAPKVAASGAKPAAKPDPNRPARQGDSRLTAVSLPKGELSPAMQAYFDKCLEKIGFIPNVLQAYAFDNAKLEAFATFYNDLMLAPSGLSKLEREMIAVAVSSINRCYYCLTAHGAAVRQLSDDPALGELMVMNYRAADLSARHVAMLDFAVKLTETPAAIVEADRDSLRAAGFNDRDIWDIGAVAAFFNMSNRMASAVDMRPNAEYHAQAR